MTSPECYLIVAQEEEINQCGNSDSLPRRAISLCLGDPPLVKPREPAGLLQSNPPPDRPLVTRRPKRQIFRAVNTESLSWPRISLPSDGYYVYTFWAVCEVARYHEDGAITLFRQG